MTRAASPCPPGSTTLTLTDPRPGAVVTVAPGTRLRLRFRLRAGGSRWHVADSPGHLLLLSEERDALHFLVFEGGAGTVRLERRALGPVREVRELRVAVDEPARELATTRRLSA